MILYCVAEVCKSYCVFIYEFMFKVPTHVWKFLRIIALLIFYLIFDAT